MATQFRRGVLGVRPIQLGHNNVRAHARQFERAGAPDATAGPSNYRNLSFQFHMTLLPCSGPPWVSPIRVWRCGPRPHHAANWAPGVTGRNGAEFNCHQLDLTERECSATVTSRSSEEVVMTWIIDTKSKRRRSVKLGAGIIISPMLALGTLAVPANAEWDGNDREHHHHWNGGYYRAPPVVYGSQYRSSYYGSRYYYPPVVYGPGIGIGLPGVNIGIGR
jgi:hypothetical protein